MQTLRKVFSVMMTNRMLNYRMLSGVVSSISGLSGQDSGPGHDSCVRGRSDWLEGAGRPGQAACTGQEHASRHCRHQCTSHS